MAHIHRYPPSAAPPHPQAWGAPPAMPGYPPMGLAFPPQPWVGQPALVISFMFIKHLITHLCNLMLIIFIYFIVCFWNVDFDSSYNRPPQFAPGVMSIPQNPLPLPQQTSLLSQPHLNQISQPQLTSNALIPPAQAPSASDLEQKRKERDKREKERKERESRKQRESEQKKKEIHKQQQTLVIAKETKQTNLLKYGLYASCLKINLTVY